MKNVTLQGERMKTELILQYISKNKLNKTSFCRLVGFSVSVLDKILKQQTNFYIHRCLKFANHLALKCISFLKKSNNNKHSGQKGYQLYS